MRYFSKTLLYLFLCGLFGICHAQKVYADITPDQARLNASEFLQRATKLTKLPVLVQNGMRAWGSVDGVQRQCYHFEEPPEGYLAIDIDVQSGIVRSYRWLRPQAISSAKPLSLAQATDLVERFAHEEWDSAFQAGLSKSSATTMDHGGGKVYVFTWSRRINEIEYPVSLHIEVSAASGCIKECLFIEHEVKVPSFNASIDKSRAMALVRQHLKLDNSWQPIQSNLKISGPSLPVLSWHIRFRGMTTTQYTEEWGQYHIPHIADTCVDANTGKVWWSEYEDDPHGKSVQIRPPVPIAKGATALYFWPEWVKPSSISLLAYRWIGLEDNVFGDSYKRNRSIIVRVEPKKVVRLLDLDFLPFFTTCSPSGSRIAFQPWQESVVYILDLKSGAIGRLNDPERVERMMPAWAPSGTSLVVSGTHVADSYGEEDIFVCDVADKLSVNSVRSNRCIAALTGKDILPQFLPDSQQVVFAHQKIQSIDFGLEISQWSLYRVQTDKTYQEKDYQPPLKIADLSYKPERLSIFPDGRRVLVSYEDNQHAMKHPPEIIDLEKKTKVRLKWPVLYDPDLLEKRPLILHELTVNSDGKRVAFQAERWSGKPADKDATCIYVCNLDGTGLKRVTSSLQTFPKPYQYPQAGVTALNAWEKLQPKPNHGQPMNRDQEWKDALKASGIHEMPKAAPTTAPLVSSP